MPALPLLVDQPVRSGAAGLLLVLPGRDPLLLRSAGVPVHSFNPGWQAVSLFTLLDPLWLLVLRHESGEFACWCLDSTGQMAPPPQQRGAADQRRFALALRQIAVWLAAADAPIRLERPAAVEAYLALPAVARALLDPLLDGPIRCPEPLACALPPDNVPLAFEPVPGTGGWRIGRAGALIPLMAGQHLAELQPGWSLEAIETRFSPWLSLVLRHDSGARAVWFSDLHGRVVAHHLGHAPAPLRDRALHAAEPLFQALWDQAVLGRGEFRPDPRPEIGGLPFTDLASLVRSWMELTGRGGSTRIWALDESLPPGMGFVLPSPGGLRGLETGLVQAALLQSLRHETDRLLRTGRIAWRSPIDGALVESDGFALLIDHRCYAYRFRQDVHETVFYVLCSAGHFRNYALYFPAIDLVVMQTRVPGKDFLILERIGETILHHLVLFDEALQAGQRVAVDPVVQMIYGECAVHIGHYIWQDLSGLAALLGENSSFGALAPDRLPQLLMFETARMEPYFGAEEQLFPILQDRIIRHDCRFAEHVEQIYRRNQRVIKYTAISVPASLGQAVRDCADNAASLLDIRLQAEAARRRGRPVIVLGIRVGNRALADQPEFLSALIAHLGQAFPGCTLVLDGLNDSADRGLDAAAAPGSALAQEAELARLLAVQARAAGCHFADTINRSALASVIWCSRADAFLAPWGAALAKYRWICNTPGLVLCSRWNLDHRPDLRIYDSPAALEGSSEMLFNARDTVQDAEAASDPGRTNFIVDRSRIFAQFEDLVRRHHARRILRDGGKAVQASGSGVSPMRLI